MRFNHTTVLMLFIALCFLFGSCLPYKYSNKRKGEEVYVEIKHYSEEKNNFPVNSVMAMESNTRTRSIAPILAVPYVFNMAIRGTSKIINKARKKYVADYIAKNSDDMFYSDNTVNATINVKQINFIRIIESKKNKKDTALVLNLGIEKSSDGNFIRIVPQRLRVNYTKAKLKLGDDKFDIDIKILINGFWLDSQKQHNIREIASLDITLYNVPIRTEITGKELENSATQWFPIIPRSHIEENIFGTGNFVISIKANEYDDYAKRVESTSENVEGNRADIVELLKEISKRKIKEYDNGMRK